MHVPTGLWVFAAFWVVVAVVLCVPMGRAMTDKPIKAPKKPSEAPPAATEPEVRTMYRTDDLMWHAHVDDHEGRITVGLMTFPDGALGVLVDDCGTTIGVRLDRVEIQSFRDAITCHLVASASVTH